MIVIYRCHQSTILILFICNSGLQGNDLVMSPVQILPGFIFEAYQVEGQFPAVRQPTIFFQSRLFDYVELKRHHDLPKQTYDISVPGDPVISVPIHRTFQPIIVPS